MPAQDPGSTDKDLRIKDVKAYPTSYPIPPGQSVTLGIGRAVKRDAVVVKVTTEGGLVGYGESHHGRAHTAIAQLVNTTLRQLILGMNAADVVGCWNRIYSRQLASHGMGAGCAMAMSGIDMALWDIRGKATGWPLYRLLGGAQKPIPAYAGGVSLGYQEPSALVDEVRPHLAAGYKAVKLRVGDTPARDLARIAAVRKAVGDGIDILTDANTAYTREGRPRRDAGHGRVQGRLARRAVPAARLPQLPARAGVRPCAARVGREPLHALRVQPRDRGRRDHHPAAGPLEDRRHHRDPAHRRDGLRLQAADQSAHLHDRAEHGGDDPCARRDRQRRLLRGRRVEEQSVPRRARRRRPTRSTRTATCARWSSPASASR